jgi:hypothetical protein
MTPKRHFSETLCIHCNICNGYILCQIVCENISFHQALFKWRYGDSNPGPLACHASALPAELYPQRFKDVSSSIRMSESAYESRASHSATG